MECTSTLSNNKINIIKLFDIYQVRNKNSSMKAFLIFLSIIVCGVYSSAKEKDNQIVDYTHDVSTSYDPSASGGKVSPYTINESFDYKKTKEWKKYKVLRACGWSSLAVGIPITLGGGVLAAFADSQYGNGGGAGVPFIVAGGVITLASVPLLISAYHYRSKAKNLGLGISAIATPCYQSSMWYNPALSVSFSF